MEKWGKDSPKVELFFQIPVAGTLVGDSCSNAKHLK
jgi:hypothetical protein